MLCYVVPDAVQVTDEDVAAIEELGRQGGLFERLAASIAPEIFGMLDVKKVGAFSHHIYAVTPRDKCIKDASATFAFAALLPPPLPPGGGGVCGFLGCFCMLPYC